MTEPNLVNRKSVHVVDTNEIEEPILETKIAKAPRSEIRATFWLSQINLILLMSGFIIGFMWLDSVRVKTTTQNKEMFNHIQRMESTIYALAGAIASKDDERSTFLKIVILRPKVKKSLARKVARLALHYSHLKNLDPDLVLALIDVESAFVPDGPPSSAGAKGLMQLMPHWVQIMGIEGSLDDPETSIKYGTTVFAMYLNMYRDVETAIAVYNQGPNQIDWDIIKKRDPTAYKYVDEVMKRYKKLKKLEPIKPQTPRHH